MNSYQSWKDIISQNVVMKSTVGFYEREDIYYETNGLIAFVSFHEAPTSNDEDGASEAYLRLPRQGDQRAAQNEHLMYPWHDHPIARRSLAVFPPVRGLWFWREYYRGLECFGEFGITLEHFVQAIEPL